MHCKLPPGPAGLPILGSLLQLGPRVHESLFHMANRHGPLMTLRLGTVTTVVASSPEAARELLGKNDAALSYRSVPDAIAAQPNPEFTLGWVPGDIEWRSRRRFCTNHLFSANRLDALRHIRHQKVRQLISHIDRKYRNTGKPVDIGKMVFYTNLNVISNALFSGDLVDADFERFQEFKDVVSRIMVDSGKLNVSDYLPWLQPLDLQGIRRLVRCSYERLHEIFDVIIDKRLRDRAAEKSSSSIAQDNEDFLDALLRQCQEKGSGFDPQNIKALLVELFVAGSDTTSITIEWTMAELLRKPDVLQKARQELLTVVGTERPVEESDIDKLPYLQAIAKETMRLRPAGPLLLPYKVKTDFEVFGYTLPRGTQVLVNAWAIGRDPNYWTEPMDFRPHRFMEASNIDYKGCNFEYIPFGSGRRTCPGMPLAVRMVPLTVASLIQAFSWRLPGGTSPEELNMEEKFGVTLKKAVPLLAMAT
ncbi:hypothetical protein SAY87_024870 [Trapa incisa]|uniref:Cytochrome P450 n=1 Tax=Trapa incisa TaxID=236973 RepID=A0AAN7GRP1_9MYRT|nr:hypothetical protein SAY87_024870 [Trapa incisa]